MSSYSVAEAKAKLSELIDRAEKGEGVVITKHGRPVAEIRSVAARRPRPMTAADLEWLDRVRVGKKMPKLNAGQLVSRMRDEGER
ncbi:MAG: type II toxin-antitoxin system Phd/YefM family antitoxin [Vitreimonas sp.]